MDRFTGFIIFAVLLVLEQMAAQAWFGPYFRFGLPVYIRRVKAQSPEAAEAPSAEAAEGPSAETAAPGAAAQGQPPMPGSAGMASDDGYFPPYDRQQAAAAPGTAEPGAAAAGPGAADRAALTARFLQASFKSQANLPSLRFKALSASAVALRAALFEGRGGLRYLPTIHSIIRLPASGEPVLTGYIDWYVLFTLYYLVATSLTDRSFVIVAILVLIIFAVSYVTQVAVNQQVAEELGKMG